MFKWHHKLPMNERVKMSRKIVKFHGSTACECYILNDGKKEFYRGVIAKCSASDLFDKEVGRIESLTKLLNLERTPITGNHRCIIVMPDGQEIVQYIPVINSNQYSDDGCFNREMRSLVWDEYWMSKTPSPKDLEGEFQRLQKQMEPMIMRLAQLCALLKKEPGELDILKPSRSK